LDLGTIVVGRGSGLEARGRRGRNTSADQPTRSDRNTGLEPVAPLAQTRTGPDTGLELGSRQDQSTLGDRAHRIVGDIGLELRSCQDRSTLGDRAHRIVGDIGLELRSRQDRSTLGDRVHRIVGDIRLELGGRQDQSIPGDRGNRIGRDTGQELVGYQARSTPGDRASHTDRDKFRGPPGRGTAKNQPPEAGAFRRNTEAAPSPLER
jgi:hypothetical protein